MNNYSNRKELYWVLRKEIPHIDEFELNERVREILNLCTLIKMYMLKQRDGIAEEEEEDKLCDKRYEKLTKIIKSLGLEIASMDDLDIRGNILRIKLPSGKSNDYEGYWGLS